MSIDPNTLPDGTAVETSTGRLCFKDGKGYQNYRVCLGDGYPGPWGSRTITRVHIPVPDDMTVEDAKAALADAGAWVEVGSFTEVPMGARYRYGRRKGDGVVDGGYVVHRDDLPPADPDAELVEKMARASYERSGFSWGNLTDRGRASVCADARAALAVVREHEAKS